MGDPDSLGVLLDHAQDKILLVDETGRVRYANDAVDRILGYDPDAFVGENAFEYVHPDDLERARAAFQRTLDADGFTEATVTYRILDSDDAWVHLESRMSNLTDDDLDGYVVSSRDVTERVAAETERRETATQLRELAATTGDVLWMFNGDWSELHFVNPAYERVYGGDPDALEDDPAAFLDTIHDSDRERVEAAMARLSDGESVDIEYRVDTPDADAVWVWVQAEPIVENGDVVRITGFTRDVTDRRRRERQLYVMDNLLRHNLRNDLSVILGEAQLIREQAPETSDHTAVIRQTAEDLLESAEKGRQIHERLDTDEPTHAVDVPRVVATAADEVADAHPDAVIQTDCPDSLTAVAADGIEVALAELVENAIMHADADHPTVTVATTTTDDDVTLTVADESPPIPDIEANVLTGDYEMNDVYHSSGLGLWLVHWIVELSDGTVTVDATDDGNRIHVTLPKTTDA